MEDLNGLLHWWDVVIGFVSGVTAYVAASFEWWRGQPKWVRAVTFIGVFAVVAMILSAINAIF